MKVARRNARGRRGLLHRRTPVNRSIDEQFFTLLRQFGSVPTPTYDASNRASMFQDTAGTLPVTAAGQPVGLLLDVSKPKGQELVTSTTNTFTPATGTPTVTQVSPGVWRITATVVGASLAVLYKSALTPNFHEGSLRVSANPNDRELRMYVRGFGYPASWSTFPRSGLVQLRGQSTNINEVLVIGFVSQAVGEYIEFTEPKVYELPGAHLIQATAADRPVYQQDGQGNGYLQFNGVTQFLQSAQPLDMSAGDEVTVCAGLRKESDSVTAIVCELSATTDSNNGSFRLNAPAFGGTNKFHWLTKGTSAAEAITPSTNYNAPITAVISGVSKISQPTVALRINGTEIQRSGGAQGTGNFGSYTLYVGRRGGTINPYSGRIYTLSILPRMFAGYSLDLIERWTALKCGKGLRNLDEQVQDILNNTPGTSAWYDASDFNSQYQDSIGSIPVTAVGQPVGLTLDKSFGLVRSAEMATNQTIVAATQSQTVNTYPTGATLVAGKTYQVSASVTNFNGVGTLGIAGARFSSPQFFAPVSANGVITGIVTCVSSGALEVFNRNTNSCTFTNITVKEVPGAHRIQPTATSRKTVEARVNLLNVTSNLAETASWPRNASSCVPAPAFADGAPAFKLAESTFDSYHGIGQQLSGTTPGALYTTRVRLKAAERGFCFVGCSTSSGGLFLSMNLTTGVATVAVGAPTSYSTREVGPGEWEVSLTAPAVGTSDFRLDVRISKDGIWANRSYMGDGSTSNGILIGSPEIQVGSAADAKWPYQRVTSPTDYADVGAPRYWQYDGIDDGDYTPTSVDTTAGDEVSVFAALRRDSEISTGAIWLESSVSSGGNNGTIAIFAPANGTSTYRFRSKGTTNSDVQGFAATIPQLAAIYAQGKISTQLASIKINGSVHTVSVSQGTGNYGNHVWYFGRRGNTSDAMAGREYGSLFVFKLLSADQAAILERWTFQKIGVVS